MRSERCISYTRLSQAWAASRCQPLRGQRSWGASWGGGGTGCPAGRPIRRIEAAVTQVLAREDRSGSTGQNSLSAQRPKQTVSNGPRRGPRAWTTRRVSHQEAQCPDTVRGEGGFELK